MTEDNQLSPAERIIQKCEKCGEEGNTYEMGDEMISEGEKKYLEHAIELAEYIDQQNMTGNLKSEILDKMLIPYGLSDERKNGQQKFMQDQPQPKPQVPLKIVPKKTDSVMDIVKKYPELSVQGDTIIIAQSMNKKHFFDLKDEMTGRGWRYIAAKHIGGEKWEPGYFEMGATA